MEDLAAAEKHIAAIEPIEHAADKITHETVAQAPQELPGATPPRSR